jgi:hypothetical protein
LEKVYKNEATTAIQNRRDLVEELIGLFEEHDRMSRRIDRRSMSLPEESEEGTES